MFETLLVRPVFNLLEFIYAIIPGHDLGIAIIIFTAIIRLLLWPLVHKQLHHAKLMRELQPELRKIKKAAKGDKQKEVRLQMELYKERGIKPFSSIGTLIVQIPIFIALYQAVLKITNNPDSLLTFSYQWVRDLPWIQTLSADISQFDETFLGFVDLTRRGFENGSFYWPAVLIVLVSTVMQFLQTRMMLSSDKDARKLSDVLKDAAAGKEADQAEVTAAVSRSLSYVLPIFIFTFGLIVPAALALYIFTSSAIGYIQQRRVFREDAEEMLELADEIEVSTESTVVTKSKSTPSKSTKTNKKSKPKTATKKKRRK